MATHFVTVIGRIAAYRARWVKLLNPYPEQCDSGEQGVMVASRS